MTSKFLCNSQRHYLFPKFNNLPIELRLLVWRFAANVPRVLHLTTKCLRDNKDPYWWHRVRSDLPIDEEDPEFYDDFEIPLHEVNRIDREIACQRLLTSDEAYKGNITRAEARQTLHKHSFNKFTTYSPYPRRPQPLCGYFCASTPGTLLACRESFEVASRVYLPTFASLGALPQTYFNFELDTLYLDSCVLESGVLSLRDHISSDDLAMVRKLALFYEIPDYNTGFGVDPLLLHTISECFPHLTEFTVVGDHFTGQRPQYRENPHNYKNLKYVNSSVRWDGSYTYRLNGYLIDGSILRPCHPIEILRAEIWHAEAASDWARLHPKRGPFSLPIPKCKSLITEEEEARLLNEAYAFESKYNKGRWYINPEDSSDFEEYPWDDLDIAELEEAYGFQTR